MQFFIRKAMTFSQQNPLININVHLYNNPTIQEIEEHIFPTIDRLHYKKQCRNDIKPHDKKKIYNVAHFAASIKKINVRDGSKFKPCVPCSGEKTSDHNISKCVK